MAFLSELIGKTVTDVDGKKLGNLKDVIAKQRAELSHPVVEALVIHHKGDLTAIPYTAIAVLLAPAIALKCRADELKKYTPAEEDIYLARDVLDKQIIDTEGARVVRGNGWPRA